MADYFAEETLARAVAVLGDVRREDDEREDAACIVQVVLRRLVPNEAEITDVLCALSTALDIHLAVPRVLGSLAVLRPPAMEKMAGGVERLLEREFVAGRHENLADVLLAALDEPVWAARIQGEWVKAAIADAFDRLPGAKTVAAMLVGGWVLARGDDVDWLADFVEERPALVASACLPVATRWLLHRAAPTVAGWRALSVARGPCPALDAALFGSRTDVAVETLEQTIRETPDESRRVTLAGWLIALRGSAS